MRVAATQMVASVPSRAPAILVVEDEVLIRLAVVDHLQDRGFRVLAVGNAAEAVQALEANLQIDLVFTDVRMPGAMDGLELARWARARRPRLPIIVASGHAWSDETGGGLAGVTFIGKPYDIGALADRILALLKGTSGG